MSRLALRTPMAILSLSDAETIMYPMLGFPVIAKTKRVFSYNDKLFSFDAEGDLQMVPCSTQMQLKQLPDGIDGRVSIDGELFVYDYATSITGHLNCLERLMVAANDLAGIDGLHVMIPKLIKSVTNLELYCEKVQKSTDAIYLKSIDAPYIQPIRNQKLNRAWYIYRIPEYGIGTICEIIEGVIIIKDGGGNDLVLRNGDIPLQYFINKYKDVLIGQEAKYVKKNGSYRLLEISALDKLERNYGTL